MLELIITKLSVQVTLDQWYADTKTCPCEKDIIVIDPEVLCLKQTTCKTGWHPVCMLLQLVLICLVALTEG
jgi:hypothetical protein